MTIINNNLTYYADTYKNITYKQKKKIVMCERLYRFCLKNILHNLAVSILALDFEVSDYLVLCPNKLEIYHVLFQVLNVSSINI